jgi:hypothetical protein
MTIHVADPSATPRLSEAVQAVSVIHLSDRIGSGTLTITQDGFEVTGIYNWPPRSIAEVQFSFRFHVLSPNTCTVEVDWPGLLPEIGPTDASYLTLLLMGRPEYSISTPAGDHVNATFLGPFGQPEITTSLQVAAATGSGDASVSLLFRYEISNS